MSFFANRHSPGCGGCNIQDWNGLTDRRLRITGIAVRNSLILLAALGLDACAALAIAQDPPSVDYLFPSGGQRGTSFEMVAGGKFPKWPVEVWCPDPQIQVEPQSEQRKFKVTVGEDAIPGSHWIRFLSPGGVSELKPLLVSTLSEMAEKEPNQSPDESQSIQLPCVINGQLAKSGDLDSYRVELSRGDTIVIDLLARRLLGSPMDAVVQVCSDMGFVLQQIDDAVGPDPRVIFRAPETGEYLIRIFAFPEVANSTIGFSGAANYVYRMTVTDGPFAEFVMPLSVDSRASMQTFQAFSNGSLHDREVQFDMAAGDHWATLSGSDWNGEWIEAPVVPAEPIVVESDSGQVTCDIPSAISSVLDDKVPERRFRIEATKGTLYRFAVTARELGSPLDAVLELYDVNGKLIKMVDDVSRRPDPLLEWKATATDIFELKVSDLHRRHGDHFRFLLTIAESEPDFDLTCDIQSIRGEVGSTVDIEVSLLRSGGLASPLTFGALMGEQHLKVEPAKIEKFTKNPEKVTLKLTLPEEPVSGPFSIYASAVVDEVITRPCLFGVKGVKRRFDHLWLTSLEKSAPTKK